jgi:hypothetical protein
MADEKSKEGLVGLGSLLLASPSRRRLLEHYVVDNRVYKRTEINLDGYTFRNCAFIGCILHTSKGNFRLESCHVAGSVIHFSGHALRIVKLASILLGNWDQLNVGLRAAIQVDGSVTIT